MARASGLVRRTVLTFAAIAGAVVLLLALVPEPPGSSAGAGAAKALVIDDVRYFDGEGLAGPAAIEIRDGRIAAIRTPGTGTGTATRRIDAGGRTLLPGLIDAHTHSFASARRDAAVFGVTTMLDMFTDPALLATTRSVRADFAATPEAALFSAGMLATVPGGHGTQYGIEIDTVDGPEEARDWVAARLAEGSDYVKLVYMPRAGYVPSLDLATARALIDAAHEAGVLAVAHIASLRGARDLLDAGIDGLVHVFADTVADEAFLEEAAARGIFVVPTLAVIAMADGRSTGPDVVADPFLGPRLTPAAEANLRQSFGTRLPAFRLELALRNVRLLHEAGVPILAGSDAPNPGTAHGATLHAELELLVRAGLTPAEALAAATTLPARHFGLEGRGRIAVGARADLLMVDGDPTQDITATRRLQTVLRNGFDLDALEQADETFEARLAITGVLGDFDAGLDAPGGLAWTATSDAMMGGASSAELERIARGDGFALAVDARVDAAFAFPWAGAYLGPDGAGTVGDLGTARAVAFEVRGTPGTYRLMIFVSGALGAPPTAEFTVSEDWRGVEIPLDDMAGVVPDRFGGLAIVAPMAPGRFEFTIDDVRLID